MLGSIREEWGGREIIEGKKGRRWEMSVASWTKEGEEKMKAVSKKDKGCRDHKQRMQFHGRSIGSSPFVVLIAGESIVDGPYYVQRR